MVDSADVFKAKILIVDDLHPNLLLLEKMLSNAGYVSVSSTSAPEKVCELHLVNHYDLILLDLEMPGMNGFQVMENLDEIETGGYLPVLVITAHREDKVRALKAGAKDFVGKPFDVAEVLIRVYNMLEVRLLYLETKKLYEQVAAEHRISERLIHDVLPRSIVDLLKERAADAPTQPDNLVSESWAEVTVLFADVLEFTQFAEGSSAEVLVGVLDDISARLAGSAAEHAVQRDRTISEAHMAAVGLPDAAANQTIRAANKAMDMTEALDRFNAHSRHKLKVRVGLEAGAPMADGDGKRKSKRKFDL